MSAKMKRLLGRRVAALRDAKNLKQHQLGRMIGKSAKYISDVETGRVYPRPSIIEKLSAALELPISSFYFFEGTDDDPKILRQSIESLIAVSGANRLRRFLRHMLVTLEE
jgi:transcriptional regulator with XRE-family HTH domain